MGSGVTESNPNVTTTPEHAEHSPLPRLIHDLMGWNALITLSLGRNTGMLSVVLNEPVTAAQLASKARVDERNAMAWLEAMAAHGYLIYREGIFAMREEDLDAFKTFPFDFEAIIDYAHNAAATMPSVETAIRHGGGVDPSIYREYIGDAVHRIPRRLYEYMLVGWLDQAGLSDVLRAGGSLAELGCGSGAALLHLAKTFTMAKFTGLDLDRGAVDKGNAEAARLALKNIRFAVRDVHAVDERQAFDVVLVLDALHHFPHPLQVLEAVAQSLKPGGKIAIAEMTATGNLETDLASPFARILKTSALVYCMQEGLHDHGVGLGTTFGTAGYCKLLVDAGYLRVAHFDNEAGYTLFVGTRK